MADPVTLRTDVVRDAGQPAMTLVTQYEAPTFGEDRFAELDVAMATKMMTFLRVYYPGYPWFASFDSHQKIATIALPILMGLNHKYIINLTTTDLADGVINGAGELLERYRQIRGAMDAGRFLDARARHSALTVRSRKVPT